MGRDHHVISLLGTPRACGTLLCRESAEPAEFNAVAISECFDDLIRGKSPLSSPRHPPGDVPPPGRCLLRLVVGSGRARLAQVETGLALAYMLKRQSGFRLFLEDGHVDMDSNLVENAIRSKAMNRRNALFACPDEGGRSWTPMASLIGPCKVRGVEPYAYLVYLFTRLALGHHNKDIDDLMPWAYAATTSNPS